MVVVCQFSSSYFLLVLSTPSVATLLVTPVSGGQSDRAVRTETAVKSLYHRPLSQGDKVVISVLINFLPLGQGRVPRRGEGVDYTLNLSSFTLMF